MKKRKEMMPEFLVRHQIEPRTDPRISPMVNYAKLRRSGNRGDESVSSTTLSVKSVSYDSAANHSNPHRVKLDYILSRDRTLEEIKKQVLSFGKAKTP